MKITRDNWKEAKGLKVRVKVNALPFEELTQRNVKPINPTKDLGSNKYSAYAERGEYTCRPSSKTCQRINAYFAAKSRVPKGIK